jgi:hypothetical protein
MFSMDMRRCALSMRCARRYESGGAVFVSPLSAKGELSTKDDLSLIITWYE